MKKIGFITSLEDPNLTSDDRLVAEPLRELGYELIPILWDQNSPVPEDCVAMVFRSCWNYHFKFREFKTWLATLASSPMPLFNGLQVSTWNLHKKYLLELEQKQARIPKTLFLRSEDSEFLPSLSGFLKTLPDQQVVLKPAVSLNGHDTFLLPKGNEKDLAHSIQILQSKGGDVLVQEFLPEIQTSGEISLIFIDGQFSHAVRKTAKEGEFRVHVEYGGRREPFQPTREFIAQGQELLQHLSRDLLFTRVDAVDRDGELILMELEIIDPMLYFASAPGSAERFAKALAQRLA